MRRNDTLVLELLRERDELPSFEVPPNNTLVIHLRLGDVLENTKAGIGGLLLHGGDPAHSCAYRTLSRASTSIYTTLNPFEIRLMPSRSFQVRTLGFIERVLSMRSAL